MRLERIEIEDFRGIGRLAVDLDRLTTVIGEHDCGKSSLLRAVGRVLDPRSPEVMPAFEVADFHQPVDDVDERAATLSITLGLRVCQTDMTGLLRGLEDGAFSVRVSGQRGGEAAVTSIDVIDRAGVRIEGIDGPALLADIRRRHPAIIVGRPRVAMGTRADDTERGGSRLRSLLLGAAAPRAAPTRDQLVDVREDLARAGARLADELGPAPQRHRSVRDMTDTPHPLVTDLGEALEAGAGHQRRIAALWLLVAIFDAVPAEGLGAEAEPILLFDDIEANLHPTWLAALCAVAFNLPFQQVVATHSPEVLSWVPLSSLRRLVRGDAVIKARSVQPNRYSTDELRRLAYHLRLNRGGSFFARCWILVEGETEAWLVPEFALLAGVEFPVEGIRTIEFAQCGIAPLLKVADDLGIAWLLLTDGDAAGQHYALSARRHLEAGGEGEIFVLPAKDIEHYLFKSGYAGVIKQASGIRGTRAAGRLIGSAVERVSKPGLALQILAAADERGHDGVPPVMRDLAEAAKRLAAR